MPVTLRLGEKGMGTVNVNGFSGEALYTGSRVAFSVTMEDDFATVNCFFEGEASSSGSQIVINGDMRCSMMGVTFASYIWTAQK